MGPGETDNKRNEKVSSKQGFYMKEIQTKQAKIAMRLDAYRGQTKLKLM